MIEGHITTTDTSGTSSINTNYIEDNPHIERIDASTLVLFFDSEDRPGGAGSHDIWYAESTDNGTTCTTPLNSDICKHLRQGAPASPLL